MPRHLATCAVAATALLTLTGCFRLDLDLAVDAGDVVSGTIVTAVDTEALEELDTMFADLEDAFPEDEAGRDTAEDLPDLPDLPDLAGLADSDELSAETVASLEAQGAQVTVTEYAEDGFVGDEVSFTELPLAGLTEAFTDEAGEETLEISRDGDTYRVAMVLDLSDAGEESVEEMDPAALGMREPEARVSVTLPGRIVEANGEIDENTVTWELAATTSNELTATATLADETGPAAAQEPAAEDSSSTGVVVAAAVGGAVLLALVGGLVLARSRRRGLPQA